MTYEIIETSIQDGRPIEIYVFRRGLKYWRYTSADENFPPELGVPDLAGEWLSTAIERSSVENTQDVARSAIKVSMPRTEDFPKEYIQNPPSEVVTLKIYRYHEFDTAPDAQKYIIIWAGRVLNVGQKGLKADIRCEPIMTSLKRPGLRRLYQTTCPYTLYGDACKVDKEAFKLTTTVQSVSGLQIVSPQFANEPDGYYTGGFVDYAIEGGFDRRFITDHTNDTLSLDLPNSIEPGDTVNAFPGCDRVIATCRDKFSNLLNYGGYPYIPQKNPFTDLVF